MKGLLRSVAIAGAIGGVAVSTAQADPLITIFGWEDGLAPVALGNNGGTSNSLDLTASSFASLPGLTFTDISGSDGSPSILDLANTITFTVTSPVALLGPAHIAVEVSNITSPPFNSGPLIFVSGFAAANISGPLVVNETTNLGTVAAPILQLGTDTFTGTVFGASGQATTTATTTNPYAVFDEFTITIPASCQVVQCEANVNISLVGVPGPVAGAGMPGLMLSLFGLLGLAWRRRNRQGGGGMAAA